MAQSEHVTINVQPETWRELNRRKDVGDSFDDVVVRLLNGENDD